MNDIFTLKNIWVSIYYFSVNKFIIERVFGMCPILFVTL